jgi:hypothetical protein
MDRIVLAFGHKRLRGKDTAGAIALDWFVRRKLPVRRDSFAHSLKEGVGRGVFGMNNEQLYGDLKTTADPFWGMTPRRMLQFVGTDLMRNQLREDIWAKTLERRAKNDPETSVVITDLRFWNEVDAIRRLGGYVIKCERQVEFDPDQDTHPSETDLDNYVDWDYMLDNTGTMEDLETQVRSMVEDITKRR